MEIDQTLDVRSNTVIDKIVLTVTVGLFSLMIALTTFQVLIRTLSLSVSAQWTVPLARFTLIIATYFGAALASRNREHIRMTYALDKLETKYPTVRHSFDLISSLIVIGFLLFALWATIPAAIGEWTSNLGGVGFATSGMLYLGISIGLAFMLFYELLNLFHDHAADRIPDLTFGSGGDRRWN